jgi:hypothetical protein
MGGGLFGTPLYLNLKCIVFSIVVIGVYYLPHPPSIAHNIVMVFLLGISAYVGLAWYDVLYDCNDKLKPTLLGWLSAPFKPAEYSAEYSQLPMKTQKTIRNVDIVVLLVIGLTFIYPFIVRRKN